MLLDGIDLLQSHICGCGLNGFVYEGMNNIPNIKVHLKTHSGNVNIWNIHVFFKEKQIGPMQEPLLLGFVINMGTYHPAHLHSLVSAFVVNL